MDLLRDETRKYGLDVSAAGKARNCFSRPMSEGFLQHDVPVSHALLHLDLCLTVLSDPIQEARFISKQPRQTHMNSGLLVTIWTDVVKFDLDLFGSWIHPPRESHGIYLYIYM